VHVVFFGRVKRELGGREREDEPAVSGVDVRIAEHVAHERSVSVGILAVDDDVGSLDHGHLAEGLFSASPAELQPLGHLLAAENSGARANRAVRVGLARSGAGSSRASVGREADARVPHAAVMLELARAPNSRIRVDGRMSDDLLPQSGLGRKISTGCVRFSAIVAGSVDCCASGVYVPS